MGAFFPSDQWHAWSRAVFVSLGAEVYTTECAFAEAAHHLKPYPAGLIDLLDALHAGRVRLFPVYPEHTARCIELVQKYPARMDVGDASLLILSELHPHARLITTDVADFRLYRRKDGTPVPAIMPPELIARLEEEGAAYDASPAKPSPSKARRARRHLVPMP
jgi:predicted nucleic acid-binding protein